MYHYQILSITNEARPGMADCIISTRTILKNLRQQLTNPTLNTQLLQASAVYKTAVKKFQCDKMRGRKMSRP